MEKVKFGLSDVHIARRMVDDNVVTYATPVALEGAVKLTVTKASEKQNFRADNKNFYEKFVANARGGSLEIANIPDWFKTAYLGYRLDVDGHLIESDIQGEAFGIIFRVDTDETPKYYAIYNCIAAENDEEHSTTQENDLGIQTSTLNLSASGEVVDGHTYFGGEVDDATALPFPTFPESD